MYIKHISKLLNTDDFERKVVSIKNESFNKIIRVKIIDLSCESHKRTFFYIKLQACFKEIQHR